MKRLTCMVGGRLHRANRIDGECHGKDRRFDKILATGGFQRALARHRCVSLRADERGIGVFVGGDFDVDIQRRVRVEGIVSEARAHALSKNILCDAGARFA